jgi:hypothetical protein
MSNYITTVFCGDTKLDVYGYLDDAEPDLGYNGDINIEDVRLADTDISVFEMIHSLNWDKFVNSVWEDL